MADNPPVYIPSQGVFEPPKADPWAGLLNLFNPISWAGVLLNTLQMTPQLNAGAFETPLVDEGAANTFINNINSMGLFGTEGFTQDVIDEAFRQNAAGNAQPLTDLIHKVEERQTYLTSYKDLETLAASLTDPNSEWGKLVSQLTADVNTPTYTPEQIAFQQNKNRAQQIRDRDTNIETIGENLAGRGITESGIGADLVTRARQFTDEEILKGANDIKIAMERENRGNKLASEGLLSGVMGAKANLQAQLDQALATARSGMMPAVSFADISESLSGTNQQRELLRYANAMATKQSLGETEDDFQRMFEDIMSIWGMKKGNKPKSSSGGFLGGLGIGPQGPSANIGYSG